jgi:Family of unknown function (DUF6703)
VTNSPAASGPRRTVERWSATPLVYLHQLPRWVLPVVLAALLLAGMLGTGWVGAVALLVLAALLGWLAYLSWPSMPLPGRLLRLGALVVLILLAAGHAFGRF